MFIPSHSQEHMQTVVVQFVGSKGILIDTRIQVYAGEEKAIEAGFLSLIPVPDAKIGVRSYLLIPTKLGIRVQECLKAGYKRRYV